MSDSDVTDTPAIDSETAETVVEESETLMTTDTADEAAVTADEAAVTSEPVVVEDTAPAEDAVACLLYTSPSPRDQRGSRMPSSA